MTGVMTKSLERVGSHAAREEEHAAEALLRGPGQDQRGEALRHFMFLERPEGMQFDDADGLRMLERATPAVRQGDIVPQLQDFATVGHMYRSIEVGIKLAGRELRRGTPVLRSARSPGGI
jgi:hypothetical protein